MMRGITSSRIALRYHSSKSAGLLPSQVRRKRERSLLSTAIAAQHCADCRFFDDASRALETGIAHASVMAVLSEN
jgi:hypothetical protein